MAHFSDFYPMADFANKVGLISSVTVYNERFKVYLAANGAKENTFAEDVKNGLISQRKSLQPKYFYDAEGSRLFEKICGTPEYYVTRTEAEIIRQNSDDISGCDTQKNVLIELGSGSSQKTRFLLKSFLNCSNEIKYVPIDVSDIMISSGLGLLEEFDRLKIDGIHSVYEMGLRIAGNVVKDPKMFIFLGSSIGNFSPVEASDFMKLISSVMNFDDSFLIGFDMVKDVSVLNSAYNDIKGYTARFNLNLLDRINRELDGEFDKSRFKHKAFYNADDGRIEMHLESLVEQDIYIHKIRGKIHFHKGETIHTENSYKFTDETIGRLAEKAGLSLEKVWKDEKNYFSLCLLKKKTN